MKATGSTGINLAASFFDASEPGEPEVILNRSAAKHWGLKTSGYHHLYTIYIWPANGISNFPLPHI
jgi:hypothetical protein